MPPNAMAGCVLPEEIMVSILTRLPVKSILRFKSVCKPWLELLSTRMFIKMHQGQFSSDPKNQSAILCDMGMGMGLGTSTAYLLNVDSNENQKPMTILDYPFPDNYRLVIVGCCNGLICMMGTLESGQGFVLWNPAMKLFKIVHLSKVDFRGLLGVSMGFGYDAEGDDFKVVRIVCLKKKSTKESRNITKVEVYSVDSDSWITVEPDFQFLPLNKTVTVNGNPHWFANLYANENNLVLVWFDVTKLVFKFEPLQTLLREKIKFVDWNGAIGAIECFEANDNERVITTVDVWVFDNVERIWGKNHTFGPIEGSVDGDLQLLKKGKYLCLKNGKLSLFDPENGRVKETLISAPCGNYIKIYGYTESLSNVKGMMQSPGDRGRGMSLMIRAKN